MKKLKVLSLALILMLGVVFFSGCEIKMFGIRIFEVETSSMAPAIENGDNVMIKGKETYKIGDIIAFTMINNVVCHRIIYTIEENDITYYICKGDATDNLDGSPADGKWLDDSNYLRNLINEGATKQDITYLNVQVITKAQIQGKVVKIF